MFFSLAILTMTQFCIFPDVIRIWLLDLVHQNDSLLREYVIIISGGIFTSSFVTLGIAIREYQDVRVSTLENYYDVSSKFLKNYRSLCFLQLEHPLNIVQGCLKEEADNKIKMDMNTQIEEYLKRTNWKQSKRKKIANNAYQELAHNEKRKMMDYIWNNTDDDIKARLNNTEIRKRYLEDEYTSIMQNYRVKIEELMKQYIQIRKLEYGSVESAFGQIDFIFSNKKNRKNFIYNCLHDRQRSVLHKIREEAWHFEEYYKEENGNLPVMLSKIMNIQNELFEKQEGEIGYTIYNSYCCEIDKQLCKLLSLTYGKGYKEKIPDIKNYVVQYKVDVKKMKEADERITKEKC